MCFGFENELPDATWMHNPRIWMGQLENDICEREHCVFESREIEHFVKHMIS